MTPETSRLRKTARPDRDGNHSTRQDCSEGLGVDAGPLAELSSASDRCTVASSSNRTRHHRFSLVVSVIAAIAVGTLATFASRPEHSYVVAFRIAGDSDAKSETALRTELVHYVADLLANGTHVPRVHPQWVVDLSDDGLLRIVLLTTGTRGEGARVSEIGHGFIAHLTAKSAKARETATEGERILAEHINELKARSDAAQRELDATLGAMPASDPREQRDAALERWRALRAEFVNARQEAALAAADFDQLRFEPEPTHGVVTAEERREAFAADLGLQQDLRELTVTLSELRAHVLTVRQTSRQCLDRLSTAAHGLHMVASAQDTTQPANSLRGKVERLVTDAAGYKKGLARFAEQWSDEFDLAQRIRIDPQSGEMLDLYFRMRALLNDFLFTAAKKLSSMRSEINGLSESQADSARYHVLNSDLTRAFQTLQGAHHRFEFAAGGIETPDNFRLDAALRSASGLRRRSQSRMEVIEGRLKDEAVSKAREMRAAAIAQTERLLHAIRGKTDQTVDQLVALQDDLTATAGMSEEFAAAVVRAELATSRSRIARQDLEKARRELDELTNGRLAAPDDIGVELVSAGCLGPPVNTGERLRFGTSAALITFLSVLLGQWWILRRV